jgi:hypothetical protein
MVIDHFSARFGSFQSAIAGARGDDCGQKSHNSPKSTSFVKCQRKHGGARSDNGDRSHPLAPFSMAFNQRPCLRRALNNAIDLVVTGYHSELCRPSGKDQDERSKLWQSSSSRKDRQN